MANNVNRVDISFRKAHKGDVAGIVNLVNTAYRGDTSRLGWTTEAELLDGQRTDQGEISALIEGRDSIILVGVKNGEVVASLHLKRAPDGAKLGMLAVQPALQGAGIGREFLRMAEEVAKIKWGAKKIKMDVISLREELITYYERRGYKRTGITCDFPVGENFGIPKVAGLVLEMLEKNIDTSSR